MRNKLIKSMIAECKRRNAIGLTRLALVSFIKEIRVYLQLGYRVRIYSFTKGFYYSVVSVVLTNGKTIRLFY